MRTFCVIYFYRFYEQVRGHFNSIPLIFHIVRGASEAFRFIVSWEKPIQVASWSWAWIYGRSLAGIAGSNSAGGVAVCCVLPGTGLFDELITRPEEYYRLWCVVVCDLETSGMNRS